MTVVPTNESINNAVNGAKEGLQKLMYQDSNGKWHAKVCCFCNRLIGHNNESSIKVGDLRVVKDRLMKNKYPTKLPQAVKQHYTVQCLDLAASENRFLRTIFLSRQSYKATANSEADTPNNNRRENRPQSASVNGRRRQRNTNLQRRSTQQQRSNSRQQRNRNSTTTTRNVNPFDEKRLGACKLCEREVQSMVKDHTRVPKIGIMSGMAIGGAPKCLLDLNEVELTLVKSARIDKHIFSFQAGGHKMIRGWHSLYYNNVDYTNGVANYLAEEARRPRTSRQTRSTTNSSNNNNESGDENRNNSDNNDPLFVLPTVLVVLIGPFTPEQRAKTMERTSVNWEKIQLAVRWLKSNNPLYKDYVLGPEDTLKPIVIDDGYVFTKQRELWKEHQMNVPLLTLVHTRLI